MHITSFGCSEFFLGYREKNSPNFLFERLLASSVDLVPSLTTKDFTKMYF